LKYTKASEAAKAVEEMNRNHSDTNLKSILKVNIANAYKDENSNKEYKSNKYLYRWMRTIKIKIDKKIDHHELRSKFSVS
jgi:hypothetical protein